MDGEKETNGEKNKKNQTFSSFHKYLSDDESTYAVNNKPDFAKSLLNAFYANVSI